MVKSFGGSGTRFPGFSACWQPKQTRTRWWKCCKRRISNVPNEGVGINVVPWDCEFCNVCGLNGWICGEKDCCEKYRCAGNDWGCPVNVDWSCAGNGCWGIDGDWNGADRCCVWSGQAVEFGVNCAVVLTWNGLSTIVETGGALLLLPPFLLAVPVLPPFFPVSFPLSNVTRVVKFRVSTLKDFFLAIARKKKEIQNKRKYEGNFKKLKKIEKI